MACLLGGLVKCHITVQKAILIVFNPLHHHACFFSLFELLSTYCFFMEQYVYSFSSWNMFIYSFFLILLVCILCILTVLVCAIEFILFVLLFCSMLVYLRYTNANISPRKVMIQLNIFFITKQSNKELV